MDIIKKNIEWFKTAVPKPTMKNLETQVGAFVEEVQETLEQFSLPHCYKKDCLEQLKNTLYNLNDEYSKTEISNETLQLFVKDRKALLDGLCDVIVTVIGIGYMANLDISGALEEVTRSNFSKFEEGKPVFNEAGKIVKGKDYTPPNLDEFV